MKKKQSCPKSVGNNVQLGTEKKLTNKSNLFQLGQNGEKIGQKFFFNFGPPPHFGVKKLVKNEKNQSCSKLAECRENWLEISFGFLDTHPSPAPSQFGTKKMLTKTIKFVPNWLENLSEITFSFLEPPAHPPPPLHIIGD